MGIRVVYAPELQGPRPGTGTVLRSVNSTLPPPVENEDEIGEDNDAEDFVHWATMSLEERQAVITKRIQRTSEREETDRHTAEAAADFHANRAGKKGAVVKKEFNPLKFTAERRRWFRIGRYLRAAWEPMYFYLVCDMMIRIFIFCPLPCP